MADVAANTSGVVPEAALDRILEALWRCRKYLDAEKNKKLDELFNVDTLLAFGVLLAGWIGLHLTPIGWIGDYVLGAIGAYGLGQTAFELKDAAVEAAHASTDAALELAAQHMAHACTDAVVDVISLILGGLLFGKLRSLLRGFRTRILPKGSRFLDMPEGRVTESAERPASEGEKPGTRATDYAVGAGVGVGMTHAAPPLGDALEKFRLLPWVLVGIAGTGLVIGGAVAMSRRPTRRRIYG
jgi:hypothetical protein